MKNHSAISISGTDGSGKTTQVKLLSKKLESDGKKVLVISGFNYFLLGPLLRMGRKARKDSSGGPVKKNKNAVYKMFSFFALIDMWCNAFFRLNKLKSEYDYVICDRSPLDQIVALAYYGFLPTRLVTIWCRLAPTADFTFLLTVDPKVARNRSKEFGLEYYTNQSKLYQLVKSNKKVVVIDGNQDPKKIFKDIYAK